MGCMHGRAIGDCTPCRLEEYFGVERGSALLRQVEELQAQLDATRLRVGVHMGTCSGCPIVEGVKRPGLCEFSDRADHLISCLDILREREETIAERVDLRQDLDKAVAALDFVVQHSPGCAVIHCTTCSWSVADSALKQLQCGKQSHGRGYTRYCTLRMDHPGKCHPGPRRAPA